MEKSLGQNLDLKVREARATDKDEIQRLLLQLIDDGDVKVTSAGLQAMADDPRNFVFVCEVASAGILVGTVSLNLCPDVMYDSLPYGVIENIVVDNSVRGSGVGRLLMAFAEDVARQHNATKLMLLSRKDRTAAHQFFRTVGFDQNKKQAFVKYLGDSYREGTDIFQLT